jgi:GNAT superfamily N-acetyltransferase
METSAMHRVDLVKVGPENLPECGIGCIRSRDNPGYQRKVEWLRKRFDEGLRFLLLRDQKEKPLGFLEYVPGEFAWRPVDAQGWLFVHCLWVFPAGQKIRGLGSRLIRACVEEAGRAGSTGVAAMVSSGTWMAGREVFLKNGFTKIAERGRFELVVHRLREGAEPRFRDIVQDNWKCRGLHIVYSDQCPMLSKSVNDLCEMAAEYSLKKPRVTVLKSAYEAQHAPSYYGAFSLLWNGRLLSDHYVSKGRFRNILQKEILSKLLTHS